MNRKEARKFAESLRNATPAVRRQLSARYADWIRRGAKAQGALSHWGTILFGVSLFIAFLMAVRGFGTPLLYAGCGIGAVIGFALARQGWVRERVWRKANPFQQD